MTSLLLTPAGNEESETLELKREASLQALAPSVAAMLNQRGGMIFVGYSEAGEWIGLSEDAASLAPRLTEQLAKAITPKEFFQITPQEDAGKFGLVIEVPEGVQKPYVYNGRIYIRAGASNRTATAEMISRLIRQREKTDERWERRPAVGVETEMLDAREISKTMRAAIQRYAAPAVEQEAPALQSPALQLDYLELRRDGWPTHAAVILFRTEKVRYYSQAGVRAAAFEDTLARIRDEKSFLGGSFQLFERVLDFLETNLPRASSLEPGELRRTERPAYPVTVLREAVVNALMHRDYQDPTSIQVRLLPDRLEIWNPGALPEEYVKSAASFTVSRPRNPDIARVFHLRGYAEMLGVGLRRIREEMAQADLPPPVWRNESGGVLLTLSRPTQKAASQRVASPEEALEELPPRLLLFLAATSPGERLTREEYQNRFAPDVSERTARNDLQMLLREGYLRPTGRSYLRAYIRTEQTWEQVSNPGRSAKSPDQAL